MSPCPHLGTKIDKSFQNVVFSSHLEFPTMDKVHKSSDSECYAPSSEHFRLHLTVRVSSQLQISLNFVYVTYRVIDLDNIQ
jgi:hypothetical protein